MLAFYISQIHLQSIRPRELPAGRADHVSRAHARGMPGGRGEDHAAHVGDAGQPREDAAVHVTGGAGVRPRLAGLRAGECERDHAAQHRAGDRPADRGQPALDARTAGSDRIVPRVHTRVQQGRADPQAVYCVLRRHESSKRRVLQPRDRCRAPVHGSGDTVGESRE